MKTLSAVPRLLNIVNKNIYQITIQNGKKKKKQQNNFFYY